MPASSRYVYLDVCTLERAKTQARAEFLATQGFGLAFAEAAGADFITCDDRLLRECQRIDMAVWCGTPVAFCDKEDLR